MLKRREFMVAALVGVASVALPSLALGKQRVKAHEDMGLVALTAGTGLGKSGRTIWHDYDGSISFVHHDGRNIMHEIRRIKRPSEDFYFYSYTRKPCSFEQPWDYIYGSGIKAMPGEDYQIVRDRIVSLINKNL